MIRAPGFRGHLKRIARKGCGVSMKGWRMVNDWNIWNILRFTEFTVSCSVAMFVHMSLKPATRKAVGQQNIASPHLTGILVFSLAWSIAGRPIERRVDHFAAFLLKKLSRMPRAALPGGGVGSDAFGLPIKHSELHMNNTRPPDGTTQP
jgi:hypothetical protein